MNMVFTCVFYLLDTYFKGSRLSSVVERVTFNPVAVGSIPTDGEETAIYLCLQFIL